MLRQVACRGRWRRLLQVMDDLQIEPWMASGPERVMPQVLPVSPPSAKGMDARDSPLSPLNPPNNLVSSGDRMIPFQGDRGVLGGFGGGRGERGESGTGGGDREDLRHNPARGQDRGAGQPVKSSSGQHVRARRGVTSGSESGRRYFGSRFTLRSADASRSVSERGGQLRNRL